MINKSISEFLQDIANSEMKGDSFAWVVATYFDKINTEGDKEKFYDSILNYYSRHKDQKEFSLIPKTEKGNSELSKQMPNKDFRIKSIRIANVRGIGRSDSDDLLYGFDLFENNTIKNAVILGPNAVGKSSIYSALEFIYANRIGETELRTSDSLEDDDPRFKEYLQHFKGGFNQSKCFINTNSGTYSLQKTIFNEDLRNKINPKNHFVSDFDIYDNGRKNYSGDPSDENSFHYLIARSLGFQEYLNFNMLVSNFSKYKRQKEKKQLNILINDKSQQTTDIKNWTEDITRKKHQVLELQSKQPQNLLEYEKRQQSILSKLNDVFSEQTYYAGSFEKANKIASIFSEVYSQFTSQKIDDYVNIESDFLQLGIQLINHQHSENCPFCKTSKDNINEILRKTESRLNQLKSFNQLKVDLNTNYTELLLTLTTLYNQILLQKNFSEKLIADISGFSELSELSISQQEFLKKIQSVLNDESSKAMNILSSNDAKIPTIKNIENIFQYVSNSNDSFMKLLAELDSLSVQNSMEKKNLITTLMSKISLQIKSTGLSEQLAILNSEVSKLELQIKSSQKRIVDIDNELKVVNQKIELFDEMRENAANYAKVLSELINKKVAEALAPIEDSIKDILNDYLLQDDSIELVITREPRILSKDDDTPVEVIVAKINRVDKSTGEIITMAPNEYFNTFRYKLYCMMVSCSIAIASRKNTGINLPLVLDDVFYASDYLSKATFVKFLNSLIKIFKKHSAELPFQFILFTHDDMVFRSAMDALALYDDRELEAELDKNEIPIALENKVHPKSKTIFSRLFSPDEKDALPTKSFDNSEYWNLLFKLPMEIDGKKIVSPSKVVLS